LTYLLLIDCRLIDAERLLPDSSQAAAAQALQLLQESFLAAVAAAAGGPMPPAVLAQHHAPNTGSVSPAQAMQQPQGTYLWGAVGSGKTMLADLFCSTLPSSVAAAPLAGGQEQQEQKEQQQRRVPLLVRRAHFHEFMQQVHQRQHELQQALPRVVVRSRTGLPVYRWVGADGGGWRPLVQCPRQSLHDTPLL
jgi:predicted ATPase